MKTYTFKIKLKFPEDNHPVILSVVHCPLEVLFDSLKVVKQFDELYKKILEDSSGNKPLMYITASDYETDGGIDFIYNDYILCHYNAIIESKSLTELLTHRDYFDFVNSCLDVRTEQDEFDFYTKKVVKNDEFEEVDEI